MAFLPPYLATPPAAPSPTALPTAINAGITAAKGTTPPFCFFFNFDGSKTAGPNPPRRRFCLLHRTVLMF